MPFSCRSPYNRTTATTQDRIRSCSRSSFGPYKDKQPCVTECYEGGPGRTNTLNAAAARLQKSFKSKTFKTSLSKRLAEARARLSSRKRMAKKSGVPAGSPPTKKRRTAKKSAKRKATGTGSPAKRQKTSKKTGCPAKSMSNCTSPCRWASGTKRSFCRTERNRKQIDEGVYVKRPPKSKTGCPTKPRSDCTSPCKWASGTKRSFCRKGKNSKK